MKTLTFLSLLMLPFYAISQDCIDSTAINPNCLCSFIYQPVCGCDGQLYNNPCEATECNGVTSYVSAYDNNGALIDCASLVNEASICDSIIVEFAGIGISEDQEMYIDININTYFTSDTFFDYAGFVLLDANNNEIAYEGLNAQNVLGFGANYINTIQLYVDDFLSLPFEGTLNLIEGYFSDQFELACDFPFNFSLQNTAYDLEGQYFFQSEFDYIQFTQDSMFIYDFEEDMQCYELISFEYFANDSILFLSNAIDENQIILGYNIMQNTLVLNINGDMVELDSTEFNTINWQECDTSSLDCEIFNVFVEAGECDSLGYFTAYLSFDVVNPFSNTFSVNGNGTQYGTFDYGNAPYLIGPLLADSVTSYEFVVKDNENPNCSDFYELGIVDCSSSSSINELFGNTKSLLFIKNILGERVSEIKYHTPYIYFYDDGSFEKVIKLKN